MSFRLETCVGYVSVNSMKMISDAFGKRLEKKGITRIQWIALYYLDSEESISQKDLAIKMKTKDPSIARLLDRMERDGLIQRIKSKEDRRVTYVKLTNKGKTLKEELLPEGEIFSDILLNGISDEDLKTFQRVLDALVMNVSNKPE